PLDGVALKTDLARIAAACVRDGCIGETIASIVAQAQSEGATDPGVRAVLADIAEDEARHAELAWRIVRWALATGDARVRRAVAAACAAQPPRTAAVPDAIDATAWRESGRLLPHEHDAIAQGAMRDVIAPCAAVLLGFTEATAASSC